MIFSVFLVALAAGALALPSLPDSDKSTQTEDYVPMSDICFFRFPTYYCTEKCKKLGQEAYCDQQKCICRPERMMLMDQNPQDHEHHETQQEAPVPTTAAAVTATVPEHNADAAIAAKPTDEEPPMKCFMGFLRPIECVRRCDQRGLESHCETQTDGEFCVCGARKDIQPLQNTNMALSLFPSTDSEETPLLCYLGQKPRMCVLSCQQRGQESYCNELNHCVCSSEKYFEDTTVSISGDLEDELDDDEEEESSPNVLMYFIRWTKLFGDDNDTEATAATTGPAQELPNTIYYVQNEGWNYEYLLALLVLGLLCVLITMELLTCYRRKKSRSKADNIFHTMPATTNKS